MIDIAVHIYEEIAVHCVPVAIVFALCNIAIRMILTSAFGGKLWIGKD